MNSDAVKRAVRSFAQGFVAVLALVAVPMLNRLVQTVADGGELQVDVNFAGAIGVAAIAGGAVAMISWAQNALEDKTGTALLPK
jgi:hypothetical protein